MKSHLILFLILFSICGCISTTTNKEDDKVYMPKDLNDCFAELKRMLNTEEIEKIKSCTTRDEIAGKYHFGLGLWIRNNWVGRKTRLDKWFGKMGIDMPDDMSGIILDSFWCHLNNKPYHLEEEVECYKQYWEVCQPPKHCICPDHKAQIRLSFTLDGSYQKNNLEFLRRLYVGRCESDKTEVWAFEKDKGWYKPDTNLLHRIYQVERDALHLLQMKHPETLVSAPLERRIIKTPNTNKFQLCPCCGWNFEEDEMEEE
jgi:hypothetical protein